MFNDIIHDAGLVEAVVARRHEPIFLLCVQAYRALKFARVLVLLRTRKRLATPDDLLKLLRLKIDVEVSINRSSHLVG